MSLNTLRISLWPRCVIGAGAVLVMAFPQSAGAELVRSREFPPTYAATASEEVLQAFSARADVSGADVVAAVGNKTRLIHPSGAPLQVAYADLSGAIYLWFPQSGELRRGQWFAEEQVRPLVQDGRVIQKKRSAAFCTNYGGAIPNIFAPEHMRTTRCPSLALLRGYLLDSRDGDVFGLSRGGSPGALGPFQARKLDDLIKRVR